ncbi:MAG: DUF6653 family protein [Alphaproteobacteria bacterium]
MSYGKWLESLMGMDDAAWARHANPWSVWTRVPILPLLVLAIWSRAWVGWWCFAPISGLVVWIFINPRAFARPVSTDNWGSMATFGERIWINQKSLPIPRHHARMTQMLNAVTALAMVPLVYGLVTFAPLIAGLSVVLVILSKLWFLDRMVWLFHDMKDRDSRYAAWLY